MQPAVTPNNEPLGITPRQLELLNNLKAYQEKHGYAPTFKELAGMMKTTKSNIARMLDCLEERGRVKRQIGAQRSITII